MPRQFSFTTRGHMAVDDATGAPIGLDDVDTRVGWLLDLIAGAGAGAELVSRLWRPATFDVLAAVTTGTGGCPHRAMSSRPASAGMRAIRTEFTCPRG